MECTGELAYQICVELLKEATQIEQVAVLTRKTDSDGGLDIPSGAVKRTVNYEGPL